MNSSEYERCSEVLLALIKVTMTVKVTILSWQLEVTDNDYIAPSHKATSRVIRDHQVKVTAGSSEGSPRQGHSRVIRDHLVKVIRWSTLMPSESASLRKI